jgi:hypothetical protein
MRHYTSCGGHFQSGQIERVLQAALEIHGYDTWRWMCRHVVYLRLPGLGSQPVGLGAEFVEVVFASRLFACLGFVPDLHFCGWSAGFDFGFDAQV